MDKQDRDALRELIDMLRVDVDEVHAALRFGNNGTGDQELAFILGYSGIDCDTPHQTDYSMGNKMYIQDYGDADE